MAPAEEEQGALKTWVRSLQRKLEEEVTRCIFPRRDGGVLRGVRGVGQSTKGRSARTVAVFAASQLVIFGGQQAFVSRGARDQ